VGAPIEQQHVAADQEQCHDKQHDRERRADLGPERGRVLLENQHGHHHLAPATENARDDIGAYAQGKDDDRARNHPGQAQGEGNRGERNRRTRAEIAGGLDERAIDVLEHAANGQHHDRQEDVAEPHHDAELAIKEVQRALYESQRLQRAVHESSAAEDDYPTEGAHNVAREERRDEQDVDEAPQPGASEVEDQVIGDRVAGDEAERGHV